MEELARKIKGKLIRYKIPHRGIEVDDERVIVRAEVHSGTLESKQLVREMSKLRLQKLNGVYGRWIFKFKN